MSNARNVGTAVLIWLVLGACGSSVPAAARPTPSVSPPASASVGLHSGTLTVDGLLRTYHLFVPSTLESGRPAPLLVVLHPCPFTGAQVAVNSHFSEVATANRFVAVYPDGAVMAATGGNCWNAGSCCTGADDVAFISGLIDRLTTQVPIDPARVFVLGASAGGAMAYRLGCELSEKVRAIASVSGALVVSSCHPVRPVSVLIMHGTADAIFPYQGGGDYAIPSVASLSRLWAGFDGCQGGGLQSKTGSVSITQWSSCQDHAVVEVELVIGGKHDWFGSQPSPLPGERNVESAGWDFFSGLQIAG